MHTVRKSEFNGCSWESERLTLLERVQLEDLEAGHVQDTDEAGALSFGAVQRAIDAGDEPLEHALVASLGNGFDGKLDLLLGLSFGNKVAADLDSRRQKGFRHVRDAQAQQMSNLLRNGVVGQRGLIGTSFLLESHRAEEQNGAHDAEDRVEVVLSHSHYVHALDGRLELCGIVNAWDWNSAIWQKRITADIVEDEALALFSRCTRQQLIEDMECALILGLPNCSRLLQQIRLNVSTRNVSGSVEVDPNEFALIAEKGKLIR